MHVIISFGQDAAPTAEAQNESPSAVQTASPSLVRALFCMMLSVVSLTHTRTVI